MRACEVAQPADVVPDRAVDTSSSVFLAMMELSISTSVPTNKPAPYVASAALLSVLKAIVLFAICAGNRVRPRPPTRCVAEFSEIVLLTSVGGKPP
jgi:hypothetical protein